jgi:hypothetical protein
MKMGSNRVTGRAHNEMEIVVKRTRKRVRAQGKSPVIPPNPTLARHADAIRALGRRCFDDMVAIGERLAACRELLKSDGLWLAWLSAEFSWSRRTADRFIDLHKARHKLRNLRTSMPLSALYTLARASPQLVQAIERRVEAGEQPSVREVTRVLVEERQEPIDRAVFYCVQQVPPPSDAPATQKILGIANLRALEADRFVRQIETLAAEVRRNRSRGSGREAPSSRRGRACDFALLV